MRLFWDYIKARRGPVGLTGLLCALFLLFGWAGGLETGLLLYCLLLWAAVSAAGLAWGFLRYRGRHLALEEAKARLLLTPDCLPAAGDRLEEDYQTLLELALADRAALRTEADRKNREMEETFGLWAHQIKNPLAAMGLILQQGEPFDTGELEQELFETEQYVEMALNYLRLGSESTDYVLRPCPLDGVIRRTVKKYARQFIRRRIRLDYTGTEQTVVTDEKWLGFVLEQLLSNALKYTPAGSVSIRVEEGSLTVADTGIGIAPEDLPRVFEKGYTGYNGRAGQKSTGLGLWLCRRILGRLGHEIRLRSVPGEGTEATVLFGAASAENWE